LFVSRSLLSKTQHGVPMNRAHPSKAILGGFAATLVLTVMMYTGPLIGMPELDIAALLGWAITGDMPEPLSAVWWLAMTEHFVNGSVIFPLFYAYLLFPLLPGRPWMRGVCWGLLLFLFAQMVAAPLVLCIGFFSRYWEPQALTVLGSLAGHIVYGAIFGAIAGQQALGLPWTKWWRPALPQQASANPR
jgi:hypothetical protein